MENENKPLLIDDSEKSSFTRIRDNFFMEEIQKMLVDIGAAVSAYKAEKIGIDTENMVKTIPKR